MFAEVTAVRSTPPSPRPTPEQRENDRKLKPGETPSHTGFKTSCKKNPTRRMELKHHGATSAGVTPHASLALDLLSSPEANEEEEQICNTLGVCTVIKKVSA